MINILAVILGLFFAFSVALFIVSAGLKKTNDLGNSEAKYYEFEESYVKITCSHDNVNRNDYMM